MPFRSVRQRAYFFARHPGLAREWARKYGSKVRPGPPARAGEAG